MFHVWIELDCSLLSLFALFVCCLRFASLGKGALQMPVYVIVTIFSMVWPYQTHKMVSMLESRLYVEICHL